MMSKGQIALGASGLSLLGGYLFLRTKTEGIYVCRIILIYYNFTILILLLLDVFGDLRKIYELLKVKIILLFLFFYLRL